MFKKVLFELNKIGPVLISQILCFNFSDWSQYLQYVQSYLEIFICHLAATVPLLETHNTSPVSRYFVDSEIWPVLMAWIRKNSVLLAAFQRAVMVHWLHSARHITLLLASFDVTLPIELEKPSWIDRTIGISPSTRWGLLSEFPALRLRFRVSHHAIYCVLLSLTSCWPFVNTSLLSFLRARSLPPHAARDRARAATGPSTFWRRASQWVSHRAPGCTY